MANSIATGKGVIIANDGMNEMAGNPNFTRPNGSHVIIDAPNYTVDNGNAETYGDASSMAAQGTVTYQYSKALPFSPVPPGCTFYIKGDAPGASLVDLTRDRHPDPGAVEGHRRDRPCRGQGARRRDLRVVRPQLGAAELLRQPPRRSRRGGG